MAALGASLLASAFAGGAMSTGASPHVAGRPGTPMSAAAVQSVLPSDSAAPSVSPAPASGSPAPAEPTPVLVPLVPVVGFWSTATTISRASLAAAVAGRGPRPRPVLVSAADLEPLAASLGVTPGSNVRALSPSAIRARVAGHADAIGILRAEDVTPGVHALAVDRVSLFGGGRLRRVAAWPLLVAEDAAATPSTFDPAAVWTLAAGGDVMLDRSVHRLAVLERRGADYPWDGGTARIVGRYCCGHPGWPIVRGRRTRHAGAVRDLLKRADVALVNLEAPTPDTHTYHPKGLVFTADPRLLAGLDRAGIDVVSLANNHIRNAGAKGIADTIRHLDRLGIRHAGAGRNVTAARRPAWLRAGGLRIAVLAYNAVGAGATSRSAGAAPLRLAVARADIRAARRAGADVVVVVPHWDREYTDAVSPAIRRLGTALVSAGADIVLGGHSHWVGPLQLVNGRLVAYSLGDLVFDLQHDARTQQGLILEATFVGRHLAQVGMHPTLILEASQPNLLEAKGGGNALLREIRRASERLGR